VCLFEDGRLRYALNEERLSRTKNHTGFPFLALARLQSDCRVALADMDMVALAGYCGMTVDVEERLWGSLFGSWFTRASRYDWLLANRFVGDAERLAYHPFRQVALRLRLRQLGYPGPVRFVEHHVAHAATAYYSAPDDLKDGSAILTIDAAGDGVSATVSEPDRAGGLRRIAATPIYDSIGAFYQAITKLLGFRILRHEGKITGLAAYGDPTRLSSAFDGLFTLSEDGLRFRNRSRSFGEAMVATLRSRVGDASREDVAAAGQRLLEDVVAGHATAVCRRTGARHLLVAGGVFANVRLNQRLHELPGVEGVFVFPHMGDGGLAVGAALHVLRRFDADLALPGLYLGPEHGEDEIRRVLESSGFPFHRSEDVEMEVAKRLAARQVVARFAGRMEFGPRALGHRSVLYSAVDPAVNQWLNERLRRSEFMPFAPMTLAEEADRCYRGIGGSRRSASFMTMTFDCTPTMRAEAAGVVHVDGTARPQCLAAADDPAGHRLLTLYRELTGEHTLVNTSFNLHEEPIVGSPEDAVRSFAEARLDALAIGPFIVPRPVGTGGPGESSPPGWEPAGNGMGT